MFTWENIITWGPPILSIVINFLIIIGKILELVATYKRLLVWFVFILLTLGLVDALILYACLPWLVRELSLFGWSPAQARLWIAISSATVGSVYPLFWGMYIFPVLRRALATDKSNQ